MIVYMAISLMNNFGCFLCPPFLWLFGRQGVLGDDGHSYILNIFSYARLNRILFICLMKDLKDTTKIKQSLKLFSRIFKGIYSH